VTDPIAHDHRVAVLARRLSEASALWLAFEQSSSTGGATTSAFLGQYIVALQGVVEGWKDLRLADPAVDMLLAHREPGGDPAPLFCDLLKGARHDVAHFQGKHHPERFAAFLDATPSFWWMRSLHGAFWAFFEAWRPSAT